MFPKVSVYVYMSVAIFPHISRSGKNHILSLHQGFRLRSRVCSYFPAHIKEREKPHTQCNVLKYNKTKMKREFGYIYREPQITLQRSACGSRAAGWAPLIYTNLLTNKTTCLIFPKFKLCSRIYRDYR